MGKVLFTSKATAVGGREGHVKSDDGLIDLKLVDPASDSKETCSNPEQLFAACYAACYDGALKLMASKKKKDIESELTAEVSLMEETDGKGVKLGVVLNVKVKGVTQEEAEELANLAHEFCPYSKATRDNINVDLKVTTS